MNKRVELKPKRSVQGAFRKRQKTNNKAMNYYTYELRDSERQSQKQKSRKNS